MTRFLLLMTVEVTLVAWTLPPAVRRMAAPADAAADLVNAATFEVLVQHLLALVAPWVALWLLGVTLHDLRAARRGTDVRAAPLWIRRMVDQALGAVLLLSVMAAPAAAAPDPVGRQVATVTVPIAPAPHAPALQSPPLASGALPPSEGIGDPSPSPTEEPPAPGFAPQSGEGIAGTAADPTMADGQVHQVAVGENLWVIARAQLAHAGRPMDDRSVHAYWTQLILQNHSVIRSGDPDLIHPGERLQLPELPA